MVESIQRSKRRSEKHCSYLLEITPYDINTMVLNLNDVLINVEPWGSNEAIVRNLRYHCVNNFGLFVDITAVDCVVPLLIVNSKSEQSYINIVTTLVSMLYETRVRVLYPLCKYTLSGLTTLMNIFLGACAFEREVWDMFGVRFLKHSDLRRIISDYGLKGFPLLKSFPVTGHYEIRYDCADKRIISYPLELTQGFRSSGDLVKFDVPRFT